MQEWTKNLWYSSLGHFLDTPEKLFACSSIRYNISMEKMLFPWQIFMDFYLSSRKKKGVSLTKKSSVLLSKKEVRPVPACMEKAWKVAWVGWVKFSELYYAPVA